MSSSAVVDSRYCRIDYKAIIIADLADYAIVAMLRSVGDFTIERPSGAAPQNSRSSISTSDPATMAGGGAWSSAKQSAKSWWTRRSDCMV